MAAIDTPWMNSMSAVSDDVSHSSVPGNAPVEAAFSPNSSAAAAAASSFPRGGRQTIIVLPQTKSPLLLATPPQVTRALAFSYPFLNPLSRLVGLVSWSTGDPWESFLLLASFWFVVLYGDIIVRWAGPLLFVAFLTAGMYARRFSVLSSNRRPAKSSSSSSSDKAKKKSGTKTRSSSNGQPKSLDEIVASLQQFTSRCNILLDPFLQMTDFLSTQVTATSATTRPALIAIFTRLLVLSPVWYLLTLWPWYVVTTRRVVLSAGTLILSWHSRPARVSRTLLWRSHTIRKSCELITGLSFTPSSFVSSSAPRGVHSVGEIEKSIAAVKREQKAKSGSATISTDGLRFTFSLFENQRRWIGIGWTSSMLAYERAAWTDDQLNPAPPKDQFQLPTIEGGAAKWRWVEGSEWEVDVEDDADDDATAADGSEDRKPAGSPHAGTSEEASWVYYDNQWTNGRRGVDGWGRYTRRRKWVRDAELVEVSGEDATPTASPSLRPSSASDVPPSDSLKVSPLSATAPRAIPKVSKTSHLEAAAGSAGSSAGSIGSASGNEQQHRRAPTQRRSWFGRRKRSDSAATASSIASGTTLASDAGADDRKDHDDDGYIPLQYRGRQGADWGLGDDVGMELG